MTIATNTGIPYVATVSEQFDPDKDAINRARHALPPMFGEAIMSGDLVGEFQNPR